MEASFSTLDSLPCDILLTPHTGFSPILENLAAREAGKSDAFIDPEACMAYVAVMRANLEKLLTDERGRERNVSFEENRSPWRAKPTLPVCASWA